MIFLRGRCTTETIDINILNGCGLLVQVRGWDVMMSRVEGIFISCRRDIPRWNYLNRSVVTHGRLHTHIAQRVITYMGARKWLTVRGLFISTAPEGGWAKHRQIIYNVLGHDVPFDRLSGLTRKQGGLTRWNADQGLCLVERTLREKKGSSGSNGIAGCWRWQFLERLIKNQIGAQLAVELPRFLAFMNQQHNDIGTSLPNIDQLFQVSTHTHLQILTHYIYILQHVSHLIVYAAPYNNKNANRTRNVSQVSSGTHGFRSPISVRKGETGTGNARETKYKTTRRSDMIWTNQGNIKAPLINQILKNFCETIEKCLETEVMCRRRLTQEEQLEMISTYHLSIRWLFDMGYLIQSDLSPSTECEEAQINSASNWVFLDLQGPDWNPTKSHQLVQVQRCSKFKRDFSGGQSQREPNTQCFFCLVSIYFLARLEECRGTAMILFNIIPEPPPDGILRSSMELDAVNHNWDQIISCNLSCMSASMLPT
ncbi:hypothetical protein VP01_659g1 [Puccinia sorghi]|uniref:Uncharacterized protein n=1 Tax=Puccinia sorghi TaxID=27349 RepID=A0A0L6UHC8_9BASI|nr:hypothetical protein VP01_659g1 [Puccinia sorghi]